MLRFVCALLIVFVPAQALACRAKIVPLPERIAQSDAIYVGVVTGHVFTAYERRLRESAEIPAAGIGDEYELRIVVRETLKGAHQSLLMMPITRCSSGHAQDLDSVVVFRRSDGSGFVMRDDNTASDVRRQLQAAP